MAFADRTPRYEIRVKGRLPSRWAAWFDGLTLDDRADGTTVISGPVADQAALHGLLALVRDLGLPLISLAERPTDAAPESRGHRSQEEN